MFRFNNKNTRTTSVINNSIVDFEQVNISWVKVKYDNAMTLRLQCIKDLTEFPLFITENRHQFNEYIENNIAIYGILKQYFTVHNKYDTSL